MSTKVHTILLATPLYPPDPGGAALHAHTYVEKFSEHGIAVKYIAFSRLLHLPFGVRHFVYLCQLLKAGKGVDLIYSLDTNSSGWAAFMVARLLWKPLLYRVGGDLLWERLAEWGNIADSMASFYARGVHKRHLLYYTVLFSLHRADRIIVPNQMLADLYNTYYGIARKRLYVIPNPMPEVEDLGYVKEERTFMYASRLVKYKNLDAVFDVIADGRERYNGVRFVIFGDGPELTHLRDRVQREGLQSWIELCGLESEDTVLRATQSCLATIAPALTEFSPNYVLRGLACKKPTLISREHGLPMEFPEMLLFDPTNRRELQEKLEYLLTEEGYLKAKQWVAALDYHQTWEDVVKKNVEIIHDLCRVEIMPNRLKTKN